MTDQSTSAHQPDPTPEPPDSQPGPDGPDSPPAEASPTKAHPAAPAAETPPRDAVAKDHVPTSEKVWSALAHGSAATAAIAWVLGWVVPGASLVGPMAIAQWGGWQSDYSRQHIAQSVKFNLVITALSVPAVLISLSGAGRIAVWLGIFAWLGFTGLATWRAASGERSSYPLDPGDGR